MSVYRKTPIRRCELRRVLQVLLDFPAHSPSFVLLLRSLFVGLDAESRMPELRRGPCLAGLGRPDSLISYAGMMMATPPPRKSQREKDGGGGY